LVGPGGAGKTTTGALLAKSLGLEFFDLDQCFMARSGDIGHWIATHGYEAYAHRNVQNYLEYAPQHSAVRALSSGFMTYPLNVHPQYPEIREAISKHPQTITLLASLNKDQCVAEIVHRQMTRPIPVQSREQEELKISCRFDAYLAIGAAIIETLRPPIEVADEIVCRLNTIGADQGA
jgi:shikimate kinase